MTNFYVTYTAKDKQTIKEFYEALKASGAVEKTRAENGCIKYEYFFPAEEPDKLFLWEVWETREAQKVHTEQPHFAIFGEVRARYGVEVSLTAEDVAE